jgi:copper chaperone CopZ
MIKRTFKIKGMHCPSCATLVECDLEDAGVKASASYPKEELMVEFDESKIDEKRIIELIKKSGYDLSG